MGSAHRLSWWDRSEGDEATFEVVVKVVDDGSAVFATQLEGVLSFQPGEVVENLEALADASARDAEGAGSEILEDSAEIKFRAGRVCWCRG